MLGLRPMGQYHFIGLDGKVCTIGELVEMLAGMSI